MKDRNVEEMERNGKKKENLPKKENAPKLIKCVRQKILIEIMNEDNEMKIKM